VLHYIVHTNHIYEGAGAPRDFSRLFIYYNARTIKWMEKSFDRDQKDDVGQLTLLRRKQYLDEGFPAIFGFSYYTAQGFTTDTASPPTPPSPPSPVTKHRRRVPFSPHPIDQLDSATYTLPQRQLAAL
jgi:hypothetical protein